MFAFTYLLGPCILRWVLFSLRVVGQPTHVEQGVDIDVLAVIVDKAIVRTGFVERGPYDMIQ
jgi:hypothetical protein